MAEEEHKMDLRAIEVCSVTILIRTKGVKVLY